jgi:phage gpG-like protein
MGGIGASAALDATIKKLRDVANGAFTAKVAKNLAAEALAQVQAEFRESRDPYGSAWAALKYRSGQPLRDTGRLASSFSSRAGSNTIEVGTNVAYAAPHQDGASIKPRARKTIDGAVESMRKKMAAKPAGMIIIPQRRMLPDGDIGPIWQAAFDDVVEVAWKKFWK